MLCMAGLADELQAAAAFTFVHHLFTGAEAQELKSSDDQCTQAQVCIGWPVLYLSRVRPMPNRLVLYAVCRARLVLPGMCLRMLLSR